MYTVYIIYSTSKSRYYVGQTNDIDDRIKRHNNKESISTKNGTPWKLIYGTNLQTRSEAVLLETKIKKRGAARYLQDINFKYEV